MSLCLQPSGILPKMMLFLLKNNGRLRLFLPSWAGKDVAPVPAGDGSSSVSAAEISDWLMLPFVSLLQYMSAGLLLLLEFEEVFGAHSSPGCFFWISVAGKGGFGRTWQRKSYYVSERSNGCQRHPRPRKTSQSSTVSKKSCKQINFLAHVCVAYFKECISPFQLDMSLSVKQLSLSSVSRTSSTSL